MLGEDNLLAVEMTGETITPTIVMKLRDAGVARPGSGGTVPVNLTL